MDLREKPGRVQTLLELLVRFRLIAVVVMVVATASFVAKDWQEIVSLPLGASEALGMWLAEIENISGAWASAQYLLVAGLACCVMFFVFGGLRAGLASIVSAALVVAALYVMGGSESMPLPMFGVLFVISVVLILLAKFSFACGLFPFVISWLFLGGLVALLPDMGMPVWLVWGVLSALGFASAMALSAVAGKLLGEGTPAAGALVKAAKRLLAPAVIGSLLVVAAVAFDMPAAGADQAAAPAKASPNVPGALLYFAVFNAWFFALLFPTMTFAPWERLRSGSRRVEMKDKKKKKPSKKK